jgi:DnaK suppressor protein
MDTEKIAKYKSALEKERGEVLQELKKEQAPEDFGSDIDHYDEEANEAEEFSNKMAASQDLKERLNAIDSALEKIRVGKYGLCENCGKNIEEKILAIDPESRLCKSCKSGGR